jgi:hypothetical protein
MDTSITNYRKYARECLELADHPTARHDRRMLLALAETWLKLAEMTRRECQMVSPAMPFRSISEMGDLR